MTRLAVLGAGAWGTALANLWASNGLDVILWGRRKETIEEINEQQTNQAYLGNIQLSPALTATTDWRQVVDCPTIVSVIPTQQTAAILDKLAKDAIDETTIVLCSKGIDRASSLFCHELAAQNFPKEAIFALSGPSFAHDVASGLPTAVSLAGHSTGLASSLANTLSMPTFRIYATEDMTGVEAGGALKNVLALAVGLARGLELGASAEAALIARGFAEMNRLALALGAKPETLAGLSGLGDLVLTCSSPQSRNFSYAMALAKGEDVSSRPLSEGVPTTAMALKIAKKHEIDTPIIATMNQVLTGDLTPREAVLALLSRPLKLETPAR